MAEVYEVASFYAHFDIVRDGEQRAAGGDDPRLRFAELRAGRRRDAAEELSRLARRQSSAWCARHAWARCDTAPVCEVGHRHVDHATPGRGARPSLDSGDLHPVMPAYQDFDAYRADGGYAVLEACLSGERHGRGRDRDPLRRGAARARRRRLSDRPQMAIRARRAEAAADGGQRRRGRARHLQGPLLSGARPAPVPGRHADRRLGGRGGGDLSLPARRISGGARDPAGGDRQGRGRRARAPHARSIFAAGPAPISAARNPRCWNRSRASAAIRATGRPSSRRSASSAGRRSSTMSRRSTGCPRS